jgi:hypothetical protein
VALDVRPASILHFLFCTFVSFLLLHFAAATTRATTRYVWPDSASPGPPYTNVTVRRASVVGVNYVMERATNLSVPPLFTPLATSLPGQPAATSYTDTDAAPLAPLFYRVGMRN